MLKFSDPMLFELNNNSSLVIHQQDPVTISPIENNILIFTVLRDKCFQLFTEETEKYDAHFPRAMDLERKEAINPANFDIPIKYVWENLFKEVQDHTIWLYTYAKNLPGFDRICSKDFIKIMNNNIFTTYGIKTTRLFKDNEYYLVHHDSYRYNRKQMLRTMGYELTEMVLDYHSKMNSLGLTDYELSILMPLVLTSTSKFRFIFFDDTT